MTTITPTNNAVSVISLASGESGSNADPPSSAQAPA